MKEPFFRRNNLKDMPSMFVNNSNGSKAVLCGRGQFESQFPPKNDASGPEQVSGAIIVAPPSKLSSKFQIFPTNGRSALTKHN